MTIYVGTALKAITDRRRRVVDEWIMEFERMVGQGVNHF